MATTIRPRISKAFVIFSATKLRINQLLQPYIQFGGPTDSFSQGPDSATIADMDVSASTRKIALIVQGQDAARYVALAHRGAQGVSVIPQDSIAFQRAAFDRNSIDLAAFPCSGSCGIMRSAPGEKQSYLVRIDLSGHVLKQLVALPSDTLATGMSIASDTALVYSVVADGGSIRVSRSTGDQKTIASGVEPAWQPKNSPALRPVRGTVSSGNQE